MRTLRRADTETKLFETYARYIWPIHRIFAKTHLSKRCKRCALSERAASLNESGLCLHCVQGDIKKPDRPENLAVMKKELDAVLTQAQGTGQRAYDALVLFSGGKDSSLLVYTLRTRYPKLRILAITIDSGFLSPTSLVNVKVIIEKLRVAHLILRPNPEIYEHAFAYAITHLKGKGCSQTVDFLDGELFLDLSRHVAAQMNIPFLIVGFTQEQVERYLQWHSFESDKTFEQSKRTTVARTYTIKELTSPDNLNVWWDGTKYPAERIARVLFPYYVWRFEEEYVKQKVVELGLVSEGSNSPLQTNNTLVPLEGLVDIHTIGYSSWEPEYSHMIRQGKSDLAFWRNVFELLEYAAKTGRFISASVDEVLKQLHLTRKEVGIEQ